MMVSLACDVGEMFWPIDVHWEESQYGGYELSHYLFFGRKM